MDIKLMIGIMMLMLGGLMLLDQLDIIDGFGGYIGPLAIITVGLFFMFSKNKDWYKKKHDKDNNKERAE